MPPSQGRSPVTATLTPNEAALLAKVRTGSYVARARRRSRPEWQYHCAICGSAALDRGEVKAKRGWRYCSAECQSIARHGAGRTFQSPNPSCEVRYCRSGHVCQVERKPSGGPFYVCRTCHPNRSFGPPPNPRPSGRRRAAAKSKLRGQLQRQALSRFVEGPCLRCGRRFIGYREARHICCPLRRNQRDRIPNMARAYRQLICERDGWVCGICGRPTTGVLCDTANLIPRAATVDHIIRYADGGSDEPSNLRCACWECNWRRDLEGGGA